MAQVRTILLPTRPQPDTIVAIFLLKKFGYEEFPEIGDARVLVQPALPQGETFDSLLLQGTLALDLGGGVLDHHNKALCTTELVAKYLQIDKDPSIQQLLAYARRDDKQGKGTLSRDPLDRAFGLSGLIAALNKANPTDPQLVVDAALPLLEAHWQSAHEHHVALPHEVAQKSRTGDYGELTINRKGKSYKVAMIISDKPSMATYLRSDRGGHFDIVVQKTVDTNHLCVLTRQDQHINLAKVAGLLRLREAELRNVALPEDEAYVSKTGRIDEVPNWYYDPATNSLLNGGVHSKDVDPSLIDWEEFKLIIKAGIELGN